MQRTFAIAFGTGVLVSIVFLLSNVVLRHLATSGSLGNNFELLMLAVWPSSFWLMGVRGTDITSWLILSESVLANGLLYGAIGLLGHVVCKSLSRLRPRKPDVPS